jgi:hypothetical protein
MNDIINKRGLRMKTRISHVNGKYDLETSADLCEVFCVPTGESSRELFESGWLPAGNDEWYQCRSARVKLNPISGNRRRKLKKIKVSNDGDYIEILENVKHLYPSVVFGEVKNALSKPHEIYYFNDDVFSILNWYDDIPYVPVLLGGRLDKTGVTPIVHYYFIDKLVGNNYPYLYISEWYEQFHYKSKLPGFEWWNGENWVTK